MQKWLYFLNNYPLMSLNDNYHDVIMKEGIIASLQEWNDEKPHFINSNLTYNSMNSVYTTWVGIIVFVLGSLHFGYLINAEQLGNIVNAVSVIVGTVIAVVGQYKTHQLVASIVAPTV